MGNLREPVSQTPPPEPGPCCLDHPRAIIQPGPPHKADGGRGEAVDGEDPCASLRSSAVGARREERQEMKERETAAEIGYMGLL